MCGSSPLWRPAPRHFRNVEPAWRHHRADGDVVEMTLDGGDGGYINPLKNVQCPFKVERRTEVNVVEGQHPVTDRELSCAKVRCGCFSLWKGYYTGVSDRGLSWGAGGGALLPCLKLA